MYTKIIKEFNEIDNYERSPLYIFLALNNLCNSNCVFCDVHKEINKKCILDIDNILLQLNELGTKYVHFMGGGEPFVEKDIFKYVSKANDLGIKVAFTTNGYALDKEKIDFLREKNISHIFFSLDGHCAEIHDELRGVKGMWETVVENIKYFKKVMPKTTVIINHVLNKKNIKYLDEMIKLKKEISYDYLNILLIKDCQQLFFTNEQITEYNSKLNYLYRLAKENSVEFLYDSINFFDGDKAKKAYNGSYFEKEYPCFFPFFSSYIDCTTGNVYPCDCTVHRDPKLYTIGNLKESNMFEIWNSEKMSSIRKLLLNNLEKCKENCDYANCDFNLKLLNKKKQIVDTIIRFG